jgi:cysteine synthase A
MAEIDVQLNGRVDWVFCATSSCGTIHGCWDYIREKKPGTKLWAVDAYGSVIFGKSPGKRLLPGHGSSRRPELLTEVSVDGCTHISDAAAVAGCRLLLEKEAILAGASSGAVLMAIYTIRDRIPNDAICVGILPDRGERYLETLYNDDWVEAHLISCPRNS